MRAIAAGMRRAGRRAESQRDEPRVGADAGCEQKMWQGIAPTTPLLTGGGPDGRSSCGPVRPSGAGSGGALTPGSTACRGSPPRVRRWAAVADGVDEAVREGRGGLLDRQRSARWRCARSSPRVDASSAGRGDLRARVGQCGSAVMPGWIVSASRAAAGSSVVWTSAGVGDAAVQLPLVTAARAIRSRAVRSARRSVSGMSRAARQIARSRMRSGIAQRRDGPGGCGLRPSSVSRRRGRRCRGAG